MLVCDGPRRDRLPALAVDPVDTTGAGDAFNGALAHALAEGRALLDAAALANAAGALAVTQAGAQPERFSLEAVQGLL